MAAKSSISNPPEDEINFDSFLKFPMFCFRLLQFDFEPQNEKATFKAKLVYNVKLNFVRFSLFCLLLGIASLVIIIVERIDNFFLAIKSAPDVAAVVQIALKTFTTFLQKSKLRAIMKDLKNIFERRAGENQKYRVKSYLSSYYGYMKLYSIIFVSLSLPIAFPIFPFLWNGTMKLSVTYWFPFDEYQPKNYPFAYFFVVWMAWNWLLYLLATDSLLYSLIEIIAMEFDRLKFDLLELKSSPKHLRELKIQNISEIHQKLFELSDKVQSIYTVNFFFSFVISSLTMCFIAFQLSTAKEDLVEEYSFYGPYLGLVCGQVYLLCAFGQKLIDSSLSVADGVYHCGWEDLKDNSLKKLLVVILLRAQKPKTLTAMNFSDISLPTFTLVRKRQPHPEF
jgi:odorant receptor